MTFEKTPGNVPEKRPGQRLITQNLLASAALFESKEPLGWTTIEDLSTLIDLFCLYDRAIVIGTRNDTLPPNSQFDLFGLLKDFIDFRPPIEGDKDRAKAITSSASKHLATFLGDDKDSGRFGTVFEIVNRSAYYNWAVTPPDTPDDIEIGKQWLLTAPKHADLVRLLKGESEDAYKATGFLVRTFLYLAYANVNQIVFTPDTTRAPVLENILAKEEQFRGRLLKRLQEPWEDHQVLDRRVTPFAAIIFKRALNKRMIPMEMAKLREELAPLRKRLHDIEDRLLWRSYDEALAAETQWNSILAEIERDFTEPAFRQASAEVKIRQALNLAGPIGDIMDKPTSPGTWAKALLGAPLEAVYRVLRRRPVIEIHRLKRQLPGPLQLERLISNLFGEVRV